LLYPLSYGGQGHRVAVEGVSESQSVSTPLVSAAPRRVLLDVDTGIDDALAILYGLSDPGLALLAITGVCGNVALDQVIDNTCRVLDAAGAPDIPVAAGASQSLSGKGARVGDQHGSDGLGDLGLPPTERQPVRAGALHVMRGKLRAAGPGVTLVASAPQTNLALLLRAQPEVRRRIERIVVVGGDLRADQEPEFNVAQDPEAASEVLAADLPIVMYPYDVFAQVVLAEAQIDTLAQHPSAAARLAANLLRARFGRLIGDAGALVLLSHPEFFTVDRRTLRIGLDGVERGRTIVDPGGRAIDVVTGVQPQPAAEAFVSTIGAYPA
jgi:pyrimidine-specific ribonucleoside hydrolase